MMQQEKIKDQSTIIDHGAFHDVRRYDNMLQILPSIQNPTPMVKLNRITPFKYTQIYCKLEWYNPFGSIKDRISYNMIKEGISKGQNQRDWIEFSSGNTAIGLQMIANALKDEKPEIKFTFMIPNDTPEEKKNPLKLQGAKVVEEANQIQNKSESNQQQLGSFTSQYENIDNPEAHYKTTGPEIYQQTEGQITHFVCALGTAGTIRGVRKYLKEKNNNIKIIGVLAEENNDIPGVLSLSEIKNLSQHFFPEEYDDLIIISNKEAYEMTISINQKESISCGPSSGLALAGLFKSIPDQKGNLAVVIFPDQCFKYASSMVKNLPEIFGGNKFGGKQNDLVKLETVLKHIENTNIQEQDIQICQIKQEKPKLDFILSFADMIPQMIENLSNDKNINIDEIELKQFMLQNPVIIKIIEDFQPSLNEIPENCTSFTLQEFTQQIKLPQLPENKNQPILIVSHSGLLSLYGLITLRARGYTNNKCLSQGMITWKKAGFKFNNKQNENT